MGVGWGVYFWCPKYNTYIHTHTNTQTLRAIYFVVFLVEKTWRTTKDKQRLNCHSDRSNGRLFAGSLGSSYQVDKCKAMCLQHANCGTIEVFSDGWCFVYDNTIDCTHPATSHTIIIMEYGIFPEGKLVLDEMFPVSYESS